MTDTDRKIVAAQGYVELGLFDEARAELNSLPESFSRRSDVVEIVVLCCMGERRWEEALEQATLLCQISPKEPGGFIHAAYCLHEMGRTREAVEVLIHGPPTLHGKAVYFYNLGCYHARLGNIKGAVEMLRQAFLKDETLRRDAKRDPDLNSLRSKLEII